MAVGSQRRRYRDRQRPPPGPRERVTLELSGVAHGGEAISRHEGRVFFVPYALPGDKVVAEIVQAARENDGLVSMNTVRARLWNEHGSTVYPPVIGATVNALAAQRALVAVGWEITTGSRTRNSGKPTRRYRYLPKRPAASPAGPTGSLVERTSPHAPSGPVTP